MVDSRTVTTTILQLAIPTPLRRHFDYLPPHDCDPAGLKPGIRLRAPFGRRQVIGILLAVSQTTPVPHDKLKRANSVLDTEPVLSTELLDLLNWASRYYQHPVGEVMMNALPALLRREDHPVVRGIEEWRLTRAGQEALQQNPVRAPKQAALLTTLQQFPEGAGASELNNRHANWRPVMKKLVEKTWVERRTRSVLPSSATTLQTGPALNTPQQETVSRISEKLDCFHTWLLDGVTGSGKTEVYLQLIERTVAQGRQALVLVPEIGLTPQLVDRFRNRLEVPVAVLHSGLNDQERYGAWQAARDGKAGVIIGTRSALFSPLQQPGLIIIDEEHDLSFKQQDGFRYSARDLAILRAQKLNIPILLGSATPSLESLYNVQQQRYTHLRLPQRAGAAVFPRFIIQDVRGQKLEHGLSAQLLKRMQQHLAQQSQVLLFLNRRGFAPVLMCHACGWHARCDRCDAHMTVHLNQQRLRCHHCGSERRLEARCPECNSSELLHMGLGTEQVESALQTHFPEARIIRIDRDTTRRKGAMQELLEQVHTGEADILLGTQMLAKGHHFPDVTLVGLLDADHGLYSVDFRATERMGQLILQVAGRAGRAERPGEVVIQTRHPDNPLLEMLAAHNYHAFADTLLQERARAELPPYTYLTLLRAESTDSQAALQFLQAARDCAEPLQHSQLLLLGPVPSPMERRAGRYRAQLLIQSGQRQLLQQFLVQWLPRIEALSAGRRVRWSVDVDPLEMF